MIIMSCKLKDKKLKINKNYNNQYCVVYNLSKGINLFQYLKKRFANYVLRFTLYVRETIKIKEPLVDLELITQALNPSLFNSMDGIKKLSTYLNSPFKNIDEVIILFRNINNDIRNDRSISHRLNFNEKYNVNLSKFFSSVDGFYLDEEKSIRILKLLLLETVTLLKPFTKDEVGVQAHNLRVLSGLIKMVTNICLILFNTVIKD